ncbi:uncharacterized protein CMC5_048170 [Chondromyces crocatus]|uniref:Sortilin N-terminal domain-containing protein n=1 Tax=Chondromyces crocatus TaxID=52 RepID=A0A0K1EIH5_CHOCO|nr:uncharacterized protein CMC5_048170 [Chondromyces crocatus]
MLLAADDVHANGRYPAAGLLVVDPNDPDHVLVRATYGIITTHDHGGEWRWTCEKVVGFGGFEDPMFGILADGRITAGLFIGLSSSVNGGCDWTMNPSLRNRYVVDLAVEKFDASRVVAVASNGVDAGQFLTQLWETTDSGATWTQAGIDLPVEFLALTLDPAPSDPERVYISGRYGAPDYLGVLQRTSDRGATWERVDIPGSDDNSLPYIGAIDPMDPDVVYVRLNRAPGDPSDALIYTDTAGDSWTTLFEGKGDMLGFALSPDGSQVAIGGPEDGLWVAPTSTFQFEQVAEIGVKCLTWTERGLYACADEFRDGFVVGLSENGGRSFTPVLHLDEVCGPLECDDQSGLTRNCAEEWGPTQLLLGAKSCDGSPTTTTSSSTTTGAGGSSSGGPREDSSGGCSAPATAVSSRWWLTLIPLGLAAALVRRRARRH